MVLRRNTPERNDDGTGTSWEALLKKIEFMTVDR